MRVAVLYTGGKDSHYALLKALDQVHDVVCLITVVARREDSYMFHTVNVKWSLLHGEAMGTPQHLVEVSGEKEREVEELALHMERLVQRCQLEGLVTGAVASTYQKKPHRQNHETARTSPHSASLGLRPREVAKRGG